VQGSVVVQTQIASEPDQGRFDSIHRARLVLFVRLGSGIPTAATRSFCRDTGTAS
jgi:hypothetical protein